jgi:hypothetical protein
VSRIKIVLFLLGLIAAVLAGIAPAHAQDATAAASDLRENNVTYEEGVPGLTSNDIDRLDNLTAQLSAAGPYFKVILLAEPVTDFDSPRELAQVVQQRLGGSGRILVFDTERSGIASTLDDADEISRAEEAAADEANRQQSYVDGVEAAADVLGATAGSGGAGGGTGSGDDGGGGGGSAGIWIVVGVVVVVVGGFLLWRMFKKSKAREAESTVSLGEGEMKVRQHVDRAGNLVLELADRVEQPDAQPEAKQLFQAGAAEFADLQDDLEAADTRPELEVVYPRIADAAWKLESAKALLDGQPAPAAPSGEPLFPAPPPPPPVPAGQPLGPVDMAQAQAPEPHYRGFSASPWLTTAATAALTMLASRAMAPQRSYRPPADDGFFFGGGSGGGGGRRRGGGGGGISLSGGSSGRGMGRRRR